MGVWEVASLVAMGLILVNSLRIDYVKDDQTIKYVDQFPTQSKYKPNYITYRPVIKEYSESEEATKDNVAHSAKFPDPIYNQPLAAAHEYALPKPLQFNPSDGISSPSTYSRTIYDEQPNEELEHYNNDDEEYSAEEGLPKHNEGYEHYKTSSSLNFEGPHQIERIKTRSYHKEVPEFDVSEYKHEHGHDHKATHGEVHYHQHKHMHNHEHKQEHKHEHKQDHKHNHHADHKHEHDHKQQHKHDHHADHKHAHDHKQEHKHDHHEAHKHGHEHKQEHKHNHHEDHKHGHDHKHQQEHKHDHKEDHKHHQDHKHDHHHGHKHQHHNDHKHDHHQDHKHDHHHGHKHQHKHDQHHGHKHDHKHDHHAGHKHGHKHFHQMHHYTKHF